MKRIWLIIYNIVTLLAWLGFLVFSAGNGLKTNENTVLLLALAQGLAVFEIMNAVVGLAGANWLLTTMQVFSRLLIVVVIFWVPLERWLELDVYSGFSGITVVTIAWSVTEIIRALYYLTDLFKQEVYAITWSRYTFFILLYPMGVIGEFMIMFTFWEWRQFEFNIINLSLAAIALSYFVFFPKLYGHMFRQRKTKLT